MTQINDTLPQFFTYLQDEDRSGRTISSYKFDLADFVTWFRETTRRAPEVATVTPLDVRYYRDYLQHERQLKPASINRRLAGLRSYFKWAQTAGLAVTNPMIAIKGIRQERKSAQWLKRHEAFALLRTATEAMQLAEAKGLKASADMACRDVAVLSLMLHAGLRVSEVCSLRLDDVVLRPRSGWVVVRFGKGRKYREVPLNNDARKATQAWLDVRPDTASSDVPDTLFFGKRNIPLQARGVQRMLAKLVKSAGLDDPHRSISPHTLRHTFGKNLIDAGVSIDRVAMLLGHESLDTTAIYTTPSASDLAAAVEMVAWSD